MLNWSRSDETSVCVSSVVLLGMFGCILVWMDGCLDDCFWDLVGYCLLFGFDWLIYGLLSVCCLFVCFVVGWCCLRMLAYFSWWFVCFVIVLFRLCNSVVICVYDVHLTVLGDCYLRDGVCLFLDSLVLIVWYLLWVDCKLLVCLVACLELLVCYLLWDLFVGVCNSVGIICTVLDIGCLPVDLLLCILLVWDLFVISVFVV